MYISRHLHDFHASITNKLHFDVEISTFIYRITNVQSGKALISYAKYFDSIFAAFPGIVRVTVKLVPS
jgi:hypothetical protein